MLRRAKLRILGSVQGVGFRPFVYRLATEMDLTGSVGNDPRGVTVEIEGSHEAVERFCRRLQDERPPAAVLESIEREWGKPRHEREFRIRASRTGGEKTAQVLPDIAICLDCAREMDDPLDRRFGYPFLNCTCCGPRFSIVRALPYDRSRTTMAAFTMCPDCRREYDAPGDRRFHAQPTACPACGPRLLLWDAAGATLASEGAALTAACESLSVGQVVAVKGLGGFHLMVDARDERAVNRLRAAKPRREKPFALMVRDLDMARTLCRVDQLAASLLETPEAPIVILERRPGAPVSAAVAPHNPHLGLMLPYTPLHRLMLRQVGFPLVATSGNMSDEPICTDEHEAILRLGNAADAFLVHDRPIARHVDDSVAWILDKQPRLLRRARGYAPRPVLLGDPLPTILALGGHLKNTIALSVGRRVFLSQHIGDMEAPESLEAFERVIEDFLRLYEAHPVAIAHDLHPDYATTHWARRAAAVPATSGGGPFGVLAGVPTIAVQHHHAHLVSCMVENEVRGEALGVVWDGAGYGSDGTIWGGEFLVGDADGFRRVAHLRPFRLPGGDAAAREPRRVALALLWEMGGGRIPETPGRSLAHSFRPEELRVLESMLERGVHCPTTSSMGRLFDAVAALAGLIQVTSFEGQAAMRLEWEAGDEPGDGYRFALREGAAGGSLVLDWEPMLHELLSDVARGVPAGRISERFHHALVETIVEVVRSVGKRLVVLSGGCFQNRRLASGAAARLREEGFTPLLHRHVPPGDGGVALGQVAVAAARLRRKGPQAGGMV